MAIRELIKSEPDATLAEVAAAIGKPVSMTAVCRTLQRLNLPRKKPMHAAEQDRPDAKAARDVFFEKFADVKADQLVLPDEFGASTTMPRTHGRAAPGKWVVTKVPHGHWKIISSIAAMTTNGITAAAIFDGATDTESFLTFVREEFATMLVPSQLLVMDNLSHTARR